MGPSLLVCANFVAPFYLLLNFFSSSQKCKRTVIRVLKGGGGGASSSSTMLDVLLNVILTQPAADKRGAKRAKHNIGRRSRGDTRTTWVVESGRVARGERWRKLVGATHMDRKRERSCGSGREGRRSSGSGQVTPEKGGKLGDAAGIDERKER